MQEPAACTLCGKPARDILVLTRVAMDMQSRYHREDDTYENMNGLRKQTQEFFCEDCFQALVDKLQALVSERAPAQPEKNA